MKIKKSLIILFIIIFVLIILSFSAFNTIGPVNLENPKEEIITFPKNSSAYDFAILLKSHGFIKSTTAFKLISKVSTLDRRLKSGTYKLSTNMDTISILLIISGLKGVPVLQRVTIPEGTVIEEIPEILRKNNINCADEFEGYVKTFALVDFREKYSFLKALPVKSLEGYLFPDTYFTDFNITPKQIVELMLDRFNEIIVPLYNSRINKKFSLHKYLTLASIVEKECHIANERSTVAGVFLKRLSIGMPLESDPTVKYARK